MPDPINDMPLKLIVRAVRWAIQKEDNDRLRRARQRARLACTSVVNPSKDNDDRPDPGPFGHTPG